jgi:RimJ/RimL family protein N-acetyltransferase
VTDHLVRIRPYRLDDAPVVWTAVRESLAELQPWMPWCHPGYSIDESRLWLEAQVPAFERGTAFEFAIESADQEYLGGCGLNQIDAANHRANLGYWVRTSAARRGIATQAVCSIRDWAFQHTTLLRLEVVVAVENTRSDRVAVKAGATREGVLKNRLLLHGAVHDATMFSFTRGLETLPSAV